MSRTEKLAKKLDIIFKANKKEIDGLATRGSRGGGNARDIEGWLCLGNGTITKAANMSLTPTMPYWSGYMPTPSTAIPFCVCAEALAAYTEIFP